MEGLKLILVESISGSKFLYFEESNLPFQLDRENMNRFVKIVTAFTIFLFFDQKSNAGSFEVILATNKDMVLVSEEIVFYGLDLSQLKLINGEKLDQGEIIKNTYYPAWVVAFNADNSTEILRNFLKVEVYDKRFPFQSDQYLKNDEESIVSLYPQYIDIDSLRSVVEGYQLQENSGIGLSYIVSTFDKPYEVVHGFITFFDIESRELLYVVEVLGLARGAGMTKHWYQGIKDAWNEYFTNGHYKYRRRALKAYKKQTKDQ